MSTTLQPELKIIPLASICESKTNPRKTFHTVALNELAESIKKQGLFTPLLVRQLDGVEQFEIVTGARRFRACRTAGLKSAPCLVHQQMGDKEALEIQIVENAQREDVPPLEEAVGYASLVSDHGYTIAALAKRVGKSEQHIALRVKLLDLSNSVREALEGERIGIGHANQLARLTIEQQENLLEWLLEDYGNETKPPTEITVNELQEHIQRYTLKALKDAPFSLSEKYLVAGVPACTECPKNSATQKELFADLAGSAICTDGECFASKVEQHTRIRLEILRQNDTQALVISAKYHGDKTIAALPSELYQISDADQEGAVAALVVDGDGKGRTVHVILKPEAKSWLEKATKPVDAIEPTQPGKTWQEKQKEENERREATAKFRTRYRSLVTDQITKYHNGTVTLELLKVIIQTHTQALEGTERRVFAQLVQEDESKFAKGVPGSFFEGIETSAFYLWAVAALDIAQIQAGAYEPHDLNPTQNAAALELGLDLPELKKQAKAELKEEAKAAAGDGTSKKAKKAKTAAAAPEPAFVVPPPKKKGKGK